MENLAVKDSSEKDLFFKRLPQSLPSLPLPVAQYKLLPLLSQALEFGGAPAVALGSILQVQLVAPTPLPSFCGTPMVWLPSPGRCATGSAATSGARLPTLVLRSSGAAQADDGCGLQAACGLACVLLGERHALCFLAILQGQLP